MTQQAHSPEPWETREIYEGIITAFDANGQYLEGDPHAGVENEDWIRIVACVNACEGIPTKELIGMKLRYETRPKPIS